MDNVHSNEAELLKTARELLLSPDVCREATFRRARFKERCKELHPRRFYDSLKPAIEKAESEILPRLLSYFAPQRIPSHLIENLAVHWIGTFLANAECTSIPFEDLADEYAKALLAEASSDTKRMRIVVPLLNFSCEEAFDLSGAVAGKAYQARLLKTNLGENPAFQGFWVFPTAEEIGRPIGAPLGTWTEWLLVLDIDIIKDQDTYTLFGVREHYQVQQAILTAFRLFQEGDIDGPLYFSSCDSLYCANARAMGWSFDLGGPGAVQRQLFLPADDSYGSPPFPVKSVFGVQ
jgi:hypothetical protein